jgi:hypothetical protein
MRLPFEVLKNWNFEFSLYKYCSIARAVPFLHRSALSMFVSVIACYAFNILTIKASVKVKNFVLP